MTVEDVAGRLDLPLVQLAAELQATLAGATVAPVALGRSAASVRLVTWADGTSGYLKVATGAAPGEGATALAAEHERLQWFAGQVPVPRVRRFVHDPDAAEAFLLTDALGGSPAISLEHRGDVEALIRALAVGLRAIHDLDPSTCPFAISLEARVEEATERVRFDLVDAGDFEPAYQRYTAPELLALLRSSVPPDAESEPVVVHGDYTVSNVLLEAGAVTGYLDVGRAGVGDRYLDLAVAARSIANNISPEALGPFFDAYGLDFPKLAKIDFYVLLDEFF